jgi:hypothetical protein
MKPTRYVGTDCRRGQGDGPAFFIQTVIVYFGEDLFATVGEVNN